MISPAGYLRGIRLVMEDFGAVTNLRRDPDDPYDPDEDRPFTMTTQITITEVPNASGEHGR